MVCTARQDALAKFIATGEASDEFLAHLDVCADCPKALEATYHRDMAALKAVAQLIDEKQGRSRRPGA